MKPSSCNSNNTPAFQGLRKHLDIHPFDYLLCVLMKIHILFDKYKCCSQILPVWGHMPRLEGEPGPAGEKC